MTNHMLLMSALVAIVFLSCKKDITKSPEDTKALPTVTTDSATNIDAHSAVIHGTINPNGLTCSCYFEFGTTTAYGTKGPYHNPNTGLTPLTVSDTILLLQPETIYHYRFVCSGDFGIGMGDDRSFTTGPEDYFPGTPGCQWIYSFFDAVHKRFDTVTVTIPSVGNWQYSSASGTSAYPTYSEQVYVSSSVVQMYSNSTESRIYTIPFVTGNTWSGPPPQYAFVNYTVSRQDSILTPAGKFYGAFLVRMSAFNGSNTTYTDNRVFVPRIGFVTRKESVTGAAIGTVSAYEWNLISVKISP